MESGVIRKTTSKKTRRRRAERLENGGSNPEEQPEDEENTAPQIEANVSVNFWYKGGPTQIVYPLKDHQKVPFSLRISVCYGGSNYYSFPDFFYSAVSSHFTCYHTLIHIFTSYTIQRIHTFPIRWELPSQHCWMDVSAFHEGSLCR